MVEQQTKEESNFIPTKNGGQFVIISIKFPRQLPNIVKGWVMLTELRSKVAKKKRMLANVQTGSIFIFGVLLKVSNKIIEYLR